MEAREPWGKRLGRFAALLGSVFVVTLAVVVTQRLSQDSLALMVGLACGVMAMLPTVVLGLLIWRREITRQTTRHPANTAPPVVVVAPQAGPRYEIFRILWDRFLDDLKEALPPEQHGLINIRDLIKELESRTGKFVEDETTVRRTVNRLQSNIETAVKKKLGLPIDREDIVQTCRWKGQGEGDYGYRINPFTVAARPYQADRS